MGINVISVEVKDVLIPSALEDAMSMQARLEDVEARVVLGDSERQVAEKFAEAAKTYTNNPIALHLRAMNMLYEGLKQNSTIVIVPQFSRGYHAAWRHGRVNSLDYGDRPG